MASPANESTVVTAQPPVTKQSMFSTLLRHAHLPTQPLARHVLVTLIGGVVAVLWIFQLSSFTLGNVALAGSIVIVIAGLSVLTGVSGQISLGNGAFMAVGAYAAAIYINHFPSQPTIIGILVGTAAGAVTGVIIGLPATRLRGPYLAGMTLAFAFGVTSIPNQYQSALGGDQGISLTNFATAPSWLLDLSGGDSLLANNRWIAFIALAGVLVTMILLANILSSRFGRQFRAIRDDDIAASLQGIKVARTRVIAFALSAACAGFGGGIYVVVNGGLTPNTFGLTLSVSLVAVMVLGGAGTLMGAVWGGIIFTFAPFWIISIENWFNLSTTSRFSGTNLTNAIFGVALIITMLVAPGGIQRLVAIVDHKGRSFLRAKVLPATKGQQQVAAPSQEETASVTIGSSENPSDADGTTPTAV